VTQPAAQQPVHVVRLEGNPTVPRLFSVATLSGQLWKIGEPVPDEPEWRITSMLPDEEGGVNVFCEPLPGTVAQAYVQKEGASAVIRIFPFNVKQTLSMARIDLWGALQKELDDVVVAKLVSVWTGINEDITLAHIREAHEDQEARDNGEEEEPDGPEEPGEPEAAQVAPTNGAGAQP
jgi:hypothetical protein